jgi:hypothetical protein
VPAAVPLDNCSRHAETRPGLSRVVAVPGSPRTSKQDYRVRGAFAGEESEDGNDEKDIKHGVLLFLVVNARRTLERGPRFKSSKISGTCLPEPIDISKNPLGQSKENCFIIF